MAVRIIPAYRKRQSTAPDQVTLRVAAYCRVSTDLEEQESSYEAQVSHYTSLIDRTPSWTMAGIYSDEGISGTSTAKREGFRKLLRDCEHHKIDYIVTKSISRFARNTLDTLQSVRKLKDLGIPVYFEKENINTFTSSGELLITILASLAQQESQSISLNVGMGIHYRFQAGKPMLNHTRFMGYSKNRGGNLEIVEEEAAVIRSIYRDYLEGLSIPEIIMRLGQEHVGTITGKESWSYSTVLSILTNEKYMGDLLLQKTYTADFLTKKRNKNYGQLPQYYVKNNHAPIVPREVFLQVQGLVLQHRHAGKRKKQVLQGILLCGECGSAYRRFTSKRYPVMWRCRNRGRAVGENRCGGPSVYETQLQGAIVSAFNQIPESRPQLESKQARLQALLGDRLIAEVANYDAQIERLENAAAYASEGLPVSETPAAQNEKETGNKAGSDSGAAAETASHQEVSKTAAEEFREQIEEMKKKRAAYLSEKAEYGRNLAQIQSLLRLTDAIESRSVPALTSARQAACTDLTDFYERTDRILQRGPVRLYDEWMVVRFIEKVIVHPDRLEIVFKAGPRINICESYTSKNML